MQAPTVVVVNLALLGCIVCIIFLLFVAANISWGLVGHVSVLLVLAVGLLVLFNWCAQPCHGSIIKLIGMINIGCTT